MIAHLWEIRQTELGGYTATDRKVGFGGIVGEKVDMYTGVSLTYDKLEDLHAELEKRGCRLIKTGGFSHTHGVLEVWA